MLPLAFPGVCMDSCAYACACACLAGENQAWDPCACACVSQCLYGLIRMVALMFVLICPVKTRDIDSCASTCACTTIQNQALVSFE